MMPFSVFFRFGFLADRLAYGTMLCLSVCRVSVTCYCG